MADELVVTKEIPILKGGFVPEPHAIVQAANGDFIVAGEFGYEAWAGRVDQSGHLKWQYKMPPKDFPVSITTPRLQAPIYWSAVAMPDDSVFLCGYLPRKLKKGVPWPGLITHLDKEGKLLSQSMLIPAGKEFPSIARIKSCTKVGDEIIGLGTSDRTTPNLHPTKEYPYLNKRFEYYWLFALDLNGKLKWEKLITMDEKYGSAQIMSLLSSRLSGGGLVFIGSGGLGSELVHTDSSGNVTARKTLPSVLLPVQPTDPQDTALQLVSPSPEKLLSVSLNDELQVTKRGEYPHSPGVINKAYRSSDQSLFLFGSLGQPNFAHAGVMKIDPTLEHEDTLVQPEKITWPTIPDAVPVSGTGEFAAVHELISGEDLSQNSLLITIFRVKPTERR
jgi:hypothetical protein